MKIKLEDIRIDGGTQPRCDIDEDLVSEYAEDMQDGDKFPPVVVFQDGANYWLADGFHRYFASKKVGYLEIKAEVKTGTKRDAILYSVSANGKHGKRRTNDDKRNAVTKLLEDEEWSQWSDREIARRCEVTHPFVSKIRKSLSGNYYQIDEPRKVKRGDQEYTVDTSNIGNGSPSKEDFEYDEETLDKQTNRISNIESPEPTDDDMRKEFARRKKLKKESAVGLEVAEKVLSQLTTIPADDPERSEAFNMIIDWINNNR